MNAALTYVIKFVADMDAAIAFHSKHLGLKPRFASPQWSEFDTGSTTLALHHASDDQPAGTCQLGFRVDDVDQFCKELSAQGVEIVQAPVDLHGSRLAKVRYPDGTVFSVSS